MSDILLRRVVLALMGVMAVANMYISRNSINIAIIRMVNTTHLDSLNKLTNDSYPQAPCLETDSKIKRADALDGPLLLSQNQQTILLACYYWGYASNQVGGGYIAYRFGFKLAIGLGLFVGALLTALFPYIVMIPTYGFYLAVAARVLTGIFHAPCVPAMQGAWSNWAPESEKSRLVGAHFTGTSLGSWFITIMGGNIGHYFGWEPIFYSAAIINMMFVTVWYFVVFKSPEDHPNISESELNFIINNRIGKVTQERSESVPYRQILTSLPVWAMVICHATSGWGQYTIVVLLAKYMFDYQGKQIKEIGFMTSLPFIVQAATNIFSTFAADYLGQKTSMSKVNVRKSLVLCATIFPAGSLLLMPVFGCNVNASLSLAIVAMAFISFNTAGAKCNPNDISPEFASIIMSIANFIANLSGFLSPQFAGVLLEHFGRSSKIAWSIVFSSAGVITLLGGAFFMTFASVEKQDWTKHKQAADFEMKDKSSLLLSTDLD